MLRKNTCSFYSLQANDDDVKSKFTLMGRDHSTIQSYFGIIICTAVLWHYNDVSVLVNDIFKYKAAFLIKFCEAPTCKEKDIQLNNITCHAHTPR
jgi:hypothetical protein